jgi:flavin reductase
MSADPSSASSIDPAEYRRCMRAIPGAVAIITTGEDGARTGLTATAVCSLTDTPPMLLACVNMTASAHPVILRTQRFAVNVLTHEHLDIANTFGGRDGREGEARFTDAIWTRLGNGAPVLAEATASFDCVLEAEHQHGSHSIFVGRVLAAAARDDGSPLLYLGGRFGVFSEPLRIG